MRKFYVIGFLVLLVFDTFTQVSFKLGAISAQPLSLDLPWLSRLFVDKWVYCAVLGYLGAFVTYMTLLKHAPIGPAFAVTHLEIVTVLLVSVIFLGERMAVPQIVGCALIIAGIAVLAFGKHDHEEPDDKNTDAARTATYSGASS